MVHRSWTVYLKLIIMLIASYLFTEKFELDKYTIKDVLYEIDPIKVVEDVDMGSELKKRVVYGKHFIIDLVSSVSSDNTKELKELFAVFGVFNLALPNIVKTFWVKEYEVFAVAYPFFEKGNNVTNFVTLKMEIVRHIQFQMTKGLPVSDIIKSTKEFAKLIIMNDDKKEGD